MYVVDDDLMTPADDATVWRYMSFAKFADVLERHALFFSRADLMTDTFEMAVPDRDLAPMVSMIIDGMNGAGMPREAAVDYVARFDTLPRPVVETLDDEVLARQVLRFSNRFLYLSCWHMNPAESAAMWDLYVTSRSEGVAIRTSVGRLRHCLDQGSADRMVFIGNVEYLDYRTDSWGPCKAFSSAFHKRRSFEHEREIRAVVVWPTYADLRDERVDPASHPTPPGIGIDVDTADLIEGVVVSPWAQGWFVDLVSALATRHGLTCAVVASDLYATPWPQP